ncbi:hypothetical protein [Streptomyces sp. NPDC014894]|uniref:hypothetical protein n=1 Tax=Streptomyces sp. NPDC014894 TaxID=3364931 RepID=UPI0036FE6110
METESVVEDMCARVYAGLRDGTLGPGEVVEPACGLMEWGHEGEAVREAVAGDPGRWGAVESAGLARRVLAETGFDPGFAGAPERLEVLRRALGVVARDLWAAGIEGEPELVVLADAFPPAAGVALADGRLLGGGGTLSATAGDRTAGAVAAVAEAVQEESMELDRKVWPLCAGHGLGAHAVERGERAVWWCGGEPGRGGHVLAEIGALARGRSRRPAAPEVPAPGRAR